MRGKPRPQPDGPDGMGQSLTSTCTAYHDVQETSLGGQCFFALFYLAGTAWHFQMQRAVKVQREAAKGQSVLPRRSSAAKGFLSVPQLLANHKSTELSAVGTISCSLEQVKKQAQCRGLNRDRVRCSRTNTPVWSSWKRIHW